MRRLTAVLAAACTILAVAVVPARAAGAGATIVSENWLTPNREVDVQLHSADTQVPIKSVRLLLPSGWTPGATRTWPTLWLLHGGLDDYTSWTDPDNTDIVARSLNHQAIVVMPDTSWCSEYSDWVSGPRWETYLTQDVDAVLRAHYHAGTARSVAGNSMGGLGAMYLTEHNPGFFRAAASLSGELNPSHSNPAYDPGDRDQPGLPCTLNEEDVWGTPGGSLWNQHDPALNTQKLAGVRLFFSSGVDPQDTSGTFPSTCTGTDLIEEGTCRETQAMLDSLRRAGIGYTYRPVPGGHHQWSGNWASELDQALGMLYGAIGA
ncbi:alpha/beta hydrolase family protein [Actinoallomurus oryzae]|uniref:Alpha/beta hydrolase family protein n=1 Tax=Actinoallomurus oryzae TaxID=502180 RepID=A0ABP8QY44_9ACTN